MGFWKKRVQSDPKPTLQEAIDDAHAKATAQLGSAGKWHEAKIYVKGTNPIRDYIVTMGEESP